MSLPTHLYPSDLSDAEWELLAPLIPPAKPGGRPRKRPMRTILDGIFYLLRTSCAWRFLPREYPSWPTVYSYFRLLRLDGTWEQLNTTLRERDRVRQGRNEQPTACIIDSQSVKTTTVGGIRDYDGAKKISGRKRPLLCDVTVPVLRATVHAADLQDRAAVPLVLDGVEDAFPFLEHIWADQGDTGKGRAGSRSSWAGRSRLCGIHRDPRVNGPSHLTPMIRLWGTSSGSGSRLPRTNSAESYLDGGWESGPSHGSCRADGLPRSTSISYVVAHLPSEVPVIRVLGPTGHVLERVAGQFDVIVIDGLLRQDHVSQVLRFPESGGIVIVDNSRGYWGMTQLARTRPWPPYPIYTTNAAHFSMKASPAVRRQMSGVVDTYRPPPGSQA